MKIQFFRFPFSLRSVMGALLLWQTGAVSGLAIEIDFSSEQGFSPTGGLPSGTGNLVGQPVTATAWKGAELAKMGQDSYGQTIRIVPDNARPDGTSGQVARTFSTPGAGSPLYSYTPGEKELGGKFMPGHSRVSFSFSLRFDDNNAGGGYGSAFRANFSATPLGLKASSKPITTFDLTRGGRFIIANNGFWPNVGEDGYKHEILCFAQTQSGAVFQAQPQQWFKVEGVLDYEKKTFTISVDGVPQTVNGNANIPFASKDVQAAAPYLGLLVLSNGTPAFRTLSVGAVSLALAPAGK